MHIHYVELKKYFSRHSSIGKKDYTFSTDVTKEAANELQKAFYSGPTDLIQAFAVVISADKSPVNAPTLLINFHVRSAGNF